MFAWRTMGCGWSIVFDFVYTEGRVSSGVADVPSASENAMCVNFTTDIMEGGNAESEANGVTHGIRDGT